MNIQIIRSTAQLLDADLRFLAPKLPSTTIEESEAPPVDNEYGNSPGQFADRFSFDDAHDTTLKVKIYKDSLCLGCPKCALAKVSIDHQPTIVSFDLSSLKTRLGLSKKIIRKNLPDKMANIVRLLQEKSILGSNPRSPSNFSKNPPPIYAKFSSLIPLEKAIEIANEQNRCVRLSKHCYPLACSTDIYPGASIYIDTGGKLGIGGNAQVKVCMNLKQEKFARRCGSFENLGAESGILRCMNSFRRFQKMRGILDTYAMGVYKNKEGIWKFVSIHPLYQQNLRQYLPPPSEKVRLKLAQDVLIGANELHTKGVHRDLSYRNVLLSINPTPEAVISDLEFFRLHGEKNYRIKNPHTGPETEGIEREVWDIGNVLYYLLQSTYAQLPWDTAEEPREKITQENLDQSMKQGDFCPEIEELLRGMLAIDPKKRWTTRQALAHFERFLVMKETAAFQAEESKDSDNNQKK